MGGYRDIAQIDRTFQDRIGGFGFIPFSVTKRFEFEGTLEKYYQRRDQYYYYYDQFQNPVGQERERVSIANAFSGTLGNLNVAYVGDNSYFGFVAPLKGWRYRIGVEQYFGFYNFTTGLIDGRKYIYKKPFSFAMRGLAYARTEGNSDDVYPFLAASPFFVRGYTNNFLSGDAPELIPQIVGSKVSIANLEVRLPFLGPRGVTMIPFRFLPTDFNVFMDAGIAAYHFHLFHADYQYIVSVFHYNKHNVFLQANIPVLA